MLHANHSLCLCPVLQRLTVLLLAGQKGCHYQAFLHCSVLGWPLVDREYHVDAGLGAHLQPGRVCLGEAIFPKGTRDPMSSGLSVSHLALHRPAPLPGQRHPQCGLQHVCSLVRAKQ